MKNHDRIIAFRADGSTAIGLGHIYRSASLADMISSLGVLVLFYRELPRELLPTLSKTFIKCVALKSDVHADEPEEMHNWLKANYAQHHPTIVLDGYHFKLPYQRAIKAQGHLLVCIDDIHACPYAADLIINHAPGVKQTSYEAADNTKFALGLRFAMLREPFLLAARNRVANFESAELTATEKSSVLVCLGGADPDNDTLAMLKLIEKRDSNASVELVLGAAYKYETELSDFQRFTSLTICRHKGLNAEEMVRVMQSVNCAITSPSTVSLEYLAAGEKLYLHVIADNQKHIYQTLLSRGWAVPAESYEGRGDKSTLVNTLTTPIDGLQAKRYKKLFSSLELAYRKATLSDSDLYLLWVNDEAVRKQSFNSSEVSKIHHEKWFDTQLKNPDIYLFVVELLETPIGQVRLSIKDGIAMISYSIANEARGKGYGFAMLHFAQGELLKYRSDVIELVGYVKRDNVASLTTFRNLGYIEQDTAVYPNAVKFSINAI